MYSDLEAIANLEFGKEVERINREAQEKIRKTHAIPRGGLAEHAKLEVQLERAEEKCRAYAQIWWGLLNAKTGGHLT